MNQSAAHFLPRKEERSVRRWPWPRPDSAPRRRVRRVRHVLVELTLVGSQVLYQVARLNLGKIVSGRGNVGAQRGPRGGCRLGSAPRRDTALGPARNAGATVYVRVEGCCPVTRSGRSGTIPVDARSRGVAGALASAPVAARSTCCSPACCSCSPSGPLCRGPDRASIRHGRLRAAAVVDHPVPVPLAGSSLPPQGAELSFARPGSTGPFPRRCGGRDRGVRLGCAGAPSAGSVWPTVGPAADLIGDRRASGELRGRSICSWPGAGARRAGCPASQSDASRRCLGSSRANCHRAKSSWLVRPQVGRSVIGPSSLPRQPGGPCR